MSRSVNRQQFGSRKDRFSYHNYLTSIVKYLEGKHTIIDLRNESTVSGLIAFVDGSMNVEMKNVTFYNPRGEAHQFNEFFVQCRNIRYVHIPEDLSISEILKTQNAALIPKPKPRRAESWKARRYQNQLLSSLNDPKPGPSNA